MQSVLNDALVKDQFQEQEFHTPQQTHQSEDEEQKPKNTVLEYIKNNLEKKEEEPLTESPTKQPILETQSNLEESKSEIQPTPDKSETQSDVTPSKPESTPQKPSDTQDPQLIVLQYEQVLQSVNKEFQKLLSRNKELEEEHQLINMKIDKQNRIVDDYKEQLQNAKMSTEKRLEMIN